MKSLIILLLLIIYYYINHRQEKIKNYIVKITKNNRIPRIIFRSNKSLSVEKSMEYYCHKKWIQMNPNYSMIWFTDKDELNFMKKLGKTVLSTYTKLKPGAFKGDFWRSCILYKYGGVYVDSQCTIYDSLDTIFSDCFCDEKHQFISIRDPKYGNEIQHGIHNGFIACTKKNPFIKQHIKDIIENVKNNYYGNSPLDVTGPLCLSKSIQKVNNTKKQFKLGKNLGKYNFYLFELEYGPFQYVKKNNDIILRKKYSLISYFNQKILNKKTTYSSMWKNRDIYNI
jgi:mannosyltransferase OCH1-like enzyme